MKPSVATRASSHDPALTAALHQLAAELRSAQDTGRVVAAFQRACATLPFLAGLELQDGALAQRFDDRRLAFPLVGADGSIGLLRAGASDGTVLTAARIHFAGAMAELASVLIDRVVRGGGATEQGMLLSAALDGLPSGVLCFDPRGQLLFANQAARALLGGSIPAEWPHLWRDHAPAGRADVGTSYVLRAGTRLLVIVARKTADGAPAAIVVTDLTQRVGLFSEQLESLVRRASSDRADLAVGVIAGAEGSPAALEFVERCAAQAPAGMRVGPIDAEAAAIVAPHHDAARLWQWLRVSARSADTQGLRAGVAALRRDGDTADAVLARAIAALEPLAFSGKHPLFVFDRSVAVSEALALMLRHECAVSVARGRDEAMHLLKERLFEGVVLELPSPGQDQEIEALHEMMSVQPHARPFFVSGVPGPWDLPGLGLPVAPVFAKPFVVEQVRSSVREALAGR